MDLLTIEGLAKLFGGVTVIDDVSLAVRKGEILGLIGPNGAGKTTVFNLISGLHRPTRGTIVLEGARLDGRTRHGVVRSGVGRTFQGIRNFSRASVEENVLIGCHCRTPDGIVQVLLNSFLNTAALRRQVAGTFDKAERLMDFVGVRSYRNERAMNAPLFIQRRLDIGIALATEPKLLLLDEPAAGLNPTETLQLRELIRRIRDELRVTVMLVEHDMRLVMNVCERIVVLNYGSKIAEGSPKEIQENPAVIEAYLGEESIDLVTLEEH